MAPFPHCRKNHHYLPGWKEDKVGDGYACSLWIQFPRFWGVSFRKMFNSSRSANRQQVSSLTRNGEIRERARIEIFIIIEKLKGLI